MSRYAPSFLSALTAAPKLTAKGREIMDFKFWILDSEEEDR
ncbi:MAG: hypothetical protein WCP45_16950 [Verrucomicrobiota bacterium]